MPIDFPSSPTLNQIYNYTGGTNVRFNKSYIYNGKGWEEIINFPGTILPVSGFYSPAGWLLCDGTPYSRTTYAALFNAITISTTGNTTISNATITNIPSTTNMGAGMYISGTNIQSGTKISTVNSSTSITMDKTATASGTGISFVVAPYGVGDGSTTFNIPDLRNRTTVGKSSTKVLGVIGGEETVQLTSSTMPLHTHTITDAGHVHGGNTGNNSNGHYHASYMRKASTEAAGYGLTITGGYVNRVIVEASNLNTGYPYLWPGKYSQDRPHVHSFTTSTAVSGITLSTAGSNVAHNNMQPYISLNFVIKF